MQVDKPGCHMCGSRETLATGVEAPTPQEAAGGAGRTEVYRCTACMASARCRQQSRFCLNGSVASNLHACKTG